jgi:hypothetical protein
VPLGEKWGLNFLCAPTLDMTFTAMDGWLVSRYVLKEQGCDELRAEINALPER